MLPEGAPLPDEDQLDYSISFDYVGPSPFFNAPTNPMIPKTRFTAFPKQPPSLTPKNPPWPKSRSSSDTTNSDNKRLSASSIASDDATDHKGEDDGVDALDDATDHNCKPGDYEGESEMKLGGACASSSGNKGRKCIRCRREESAWDALEIRLMRRTEENWGKLRGLWRDSAFDWRLER